MQFSYATSIVRYLALLYQSGVYDSAKELGYDRLTNRRKLLCPSSEEK